MVVTARQELGDWKCVPLCAVLWRYKPYLLSEVWLAKYLQWCAVAQLVEALSYKPEGRGFDSRCGHSPGFDSASNRNEYQGSSLGVKAAGA